VSDNKEYVGMPLHQFPVQSDGLKIGLRDYFAGQALAGLLAQYGNGGNQSLAIESYDIADAMLAEREGRKGGRA